MNTVYVVAPELTTRGVPEPQAFFPAVMEALQDFITVSVLRNVRQLLPCQPDTGDVIVLFNREDADYLAELTQFLQRVERAGVKILTVAMSAASRRPPAAAGASQSFDVVDQLRQRALGPAQLETVAKVFARQVLSVLKPTLVTEPMSLFLSHRRLDGEDLTAAFMRLRTSSTNRAFRDLFDVKVGEDAQEVIDQKLRESDAVVFLDTPKAGTSPWITKELRGALELGLPIVWVRIGPEEGRVPLAFPPLDRPHFVLPDVDPRTEELPTTLVEEIIHMAARVHHSDYVDRLFSEFLRLQDIAAEHGIKLKQLDARKMVYSLELDRPRDRYKQRPLVHLLQLFGRTPTRQDIAEFAACAEAGGYERHPQHGHFYDSAILLASTPPKASPDLDEGGVHTDSIGQYVAEIERFRKPKAVGGKRLVISGAFPDCEPAYQQNMTAALHAVAEAALRSGLGVTFGAHPTFQFMLFDLAKRLRPDDVREALRMYISRHFVKDATIDEFQQNAEVRATPAIEGADARARSLTVLRKEMLGDPEGSALVVIGGKTARPGIAPGIDEEIEFARSRGTPVFIFGSVGGRSSEIIGRMTPAERVELNGQPQALSEALATSLDYSRLAQSIVDTLL